MKKLSYRRHNALFSSRTRVVTAFFGVLLLVGIALRFIAPSFFFSLSKPFFAFGNGATVFVQGITHTFGSGPALHARITALEGEVRALSNENTTLRAGLADANALTASDVPSRIVGVIARPPLSPYDVLIIAGGVEEGVVAGALVTGEGGVPLGTVSASYAHTAHVLLYSQSGRVTEGWVGETRIPVTVTGKGGGVFTAEVPRDVEVVQGDVVYLPGPGALPVGRVEAIEEDASSPSALLRIAPLANIFSLSSVRVMLAP